MGFTTESLLSRLETTQLGRHAVLLDTVDSTNSEARRRLMDGLPDGAVFIAEAQTGGRGRRGRRWVSEPGCGLWMSAALRPGMPLEETQKLTLLAGLAVCRAVGRVTGGAAQPIIKWPNDVLLAGRKLCGILCETAVDGAGALWVIAGVGVNTRRPQAGWGDAAGAAVSLEEACGREPERLALAAAILNEMEPLLSVWQREGFSAVAEGYRAHMMPAGTPVEIINGARRRQGAIEGLSGSGALLVRMDDGTVECVISGEISVRGVGSYA